MVWQAEAGLVVALATILGLLVGSFLNVVIHRMPLMLERQWAADCAAAAVAEALGPAAAANAGTDGAAPAPAPVPVEDTFNLMVPRSRCGSCGHAICWYENIPVFSYLALRGRCSACRQPIGLRYPAVELATGTLGAYCAARWGASPEALAWFGFSACVLALALIDWDTTYLPDDMTLPLLWSGLLLATVGWIPVPLPDAVLGAAGGYLSLWLVYWGFKLATDKEGMGFGDFKLFAALGAWFGWQALVPIILMSSVIGAVVGIALKLGPGLREGDYVPFGPFLAGAGLTALVVGPRAMLGAVGL